jgi:3-isopropylmalate/(R)-2-methylmalate dehydratase small subunit
MSAESRVERIEGRAIPIHGQDIDTDRIIPARFLKAVTFEGLEAHVFEDDRRAFQKQGIVHAFDHEPFAGATVLLANANFGCGSSREHAPQALLRWGIRAIVAESFAEIFFGNSVMIGLPCLTASHADIDRLMAMVEANPAERFMIDIKSGQLASLAFTAPVSLPASARQAFLSGEWDATGLLLANYEDVEHTAARLPYLHGFQA